MDNNKVLNKAEQATIIRKAIKKYGIEMQLDRAVEEFAELISAIQHIRREQSVKSINHFHEEVADAWNMLDALLEMFDRGAIEDVRHDKLVKLQKRMRGA